MTVYTRPQSQTEINPLPPSNVTRVDLRPIDGTLQGFPDIQGIRVKKWELLPGKDSHEDMRRMWGPPDHVTINHSKSLNEMADWLEARGYRVYRWPTGARAFWGEPKPVRTRHQIRRMLQRMEARKAAGDPALQDVQIHTLDLKFSW